MTLFCATLLYSVGSPEIASTISLDELTALSDEIAALVKAGEPLDQAMIQLGHEMPGQLGAHAAILGQRLNAGETLTGILERDQDLFPAYWRAVALAGIRSGQLAVALQGVSQTMKRVASMRSAMRLAMVYPLIVLIVAYNVLVFHMAKILPVVTRAYDDFVGESTLFLDALNWLAAQDWLGGWSGALVIVGVMGAWYWYGLQLKRPDISSWRFLISSRVIRYGRLAAFADALSLMLKHHVPMDEAVTLAGDASGDNVLKRSARDISIRLQGGEAIERGDLRDTGLPPMLGWLIASKYEEPRLPELIRSIAQTYHEKAELAAQWSAFFVPLILATSIGGTIVLTHGLIVFQPFCQMLVEVGKPFY